MFKDIIKDILIDGSPYTTFFNIDTEEKRRIYDEYSDWIDNVKNNILILQDEDEYNYWLDLFNKYNPDYSSPKSNNFSSFAGLSYLINMSNCFLNIQ